MAGDFKTGAVVAAVLCATFATSAFAERGFGGAGGGEMMLEMFDTIDADKDGKITEAEMEAHRAAQFAAADTNGDGLLSAEEMTAMHIAQMSGRMAERMARMIEERDDNGDGSLSAEEMNQTVRERRFARLDTDGDGAISKAEMEAMRDHMGEGRKHRGGHGRGMGMDMGGMGD